MPWAARRKGAQRRAGPMENKLLMCPVSVYTETGHISNLFSIGPALLWAPFLLAAHGIVLLCNAYGAHIPADGFSFPYLLAMALGTAIYGFLGLLFSYSLARKYVEERWAFLATLGIWGALASRLHVLQSCVVARPFRLCRSFFSLVLGAHARLANFSPMDFAGPGFRADARRLFCQRRFPGP